MKSWTELQTLQIDGDRECPDTFFISDNNGKKNVVIMGANDKYIVGKFSDGKFVPSQEVRTLQYATGISRETAYAGQTFSNLPDGRIVRICWGQLPKWEHNFRGQMSFPLELKLEDINGTKYLSAKPIKEIETLFMNTDTVRNIKDVYKRQTYTYLKNKKFFKGKPASCFFKGVKIRRCMHLPYRCFNRHKLVRLPYGSREHLRYRLG